jgi:hypothetical protein
MGEGYWGNGYWGDGYWGNEYWGEGGTTPTPPPTVSTHGVWVRRRRLPEPLLQALKKYLELKVDNS